MEDHYCSQSAADNWFCWAYDELADVFIPWAPNSVLNLIDHSVEEQRRAAPAAAAREVSVRNRQQKASPQGVGTVEEWFSSFSLQQYSQLADALDSALEEHVEEMINDPSIKMKQSKRDLLMAYLRRAAKYKPLMEKWKKRALDEV